MSLQRSDRKMHDLLDVAASYAERTRDVGRRTLSRCAKSAEKQVRTDEHLSQSGHELHESRERLSRVAENLDVTSLVIASRSPIAAPTAPPAARAASPSQVQLPAYVLEPPSGPQWIHEIKQDGYRLLCLRDRHDVAIVDGEGRDWSRSFPKLVAALLSLNVDRFKIDGDAVRFDDNGLSSRLRLDQALFSGADADVTFFASDLLSLDGKDFAHLPLLERKKRLRKLLHANGSERVRYAAHLRQNGKRMLQQAYLLGLEGIVSKRCDAPYRAGLGLDWQLTKCARRH